MLAGLRLRPGAAAAVLGRPVSEFTDQLIPAHSTFGAAVERATEKALAATTPVQRVLALQNLVLDRLADREPSVDVAVTRAIGMLQRHPLRQVSELAAVLDLSERQLRRRFAVAVGYGPKRFGRILRFQRLLDLTHHRGDRASWAELAVEARYTDQPHMINECRALAGTSPVGCLLTQQPRKLLPSNPSG